MQATLTEQEQSAPGSASSPKPGNGTFLAHIPTSEGRRAPRIMQILPISQWEAAGVRLEKGLRILCDPSHDKIALPLQTSALALRLQFTRLSCQIHSHSVSRRI